MDGTGGLDAAPDSNAAHAAWDRRFPTKLVTLPREDAAPFNAGRHLGRSGFGSVHETNLDGNVVALKRVWIRGTPKDHHKAEFEVLQKMSIKRHRHVVEAIGLYVLPARPFTELGLLIWPVAQYDLARLLSHFQTLHGLQLKSISDRPLEYLTDEEKDAVEELSGLAQTQWPEGAWYQTVNPSILLGVLFNKTRRCLAKVIGCLAKALQYLHDDQHIRHKDLKPSQVLLSSDGLWLTDFGWSVEVSSLSNSATSNGDNTTTRYHAPERENKGRCGRSEDVFGLGCIYLEVAVALSCVIVEGVSNPIGEKGWSFQANLGHLEGWLQRIPDELAGLRVLIRSMLALDPTHRPSMSEIVESLHALERTSDVYEYFGLCCKLP